MKPEPLVAAIEEARARNPRARVVLLAPQGRVFKQSVAQRMAGEDEFVLLCGRYEGVDERVRPLSTKRFPSATTPSAAANRRPTVVIDAVTRLVPGVLGNADSAPTNPLATACSNIRNTPGPKSFAA